MSERALITPISKAVITCTMNDGTERVFTIDNKQLIELEFESDIGGNYLCPKTEEVISVESMARVSVVTRGHGRLVEIT